MKRSILTGLVMMVVLSLASGAFAGSVALLGSDPGSGFVSGYLVGTGLFSPSDITYIDTTYTTPTLSDLLGYQSVLVWTNHVPLSAVGLGDTLADYVDAGGGVVMATFDWYGGFAVGGRIAGTDYSPFTGQGSYYSTAYLGSYNAAHPLMAGVSVVEGYHRDIVELNPGAELVARWTDGGEFVATNHGGKVVGITLYPGEYSSYGLSGDYPRLFANSLNYTANPCVPEPSGLLAMISGVAGLGLLKFRKRR